ncbi:hypothetical protein SOCEGT47_000680 [Sorangium cellulosum]|uniref:Uncharacterized protein n=1 Tax=Sorangium cellulosum TaxID=56 RepID=A0A4P2PT31_SORCE|nr:hypothetical protein [Sorangium cellulosum]AUX19616.1 hypothetical protein SOCEGT47_000680 [Sorangium cellulosum]
MSNRQDSPGALSFQPAAGLHGRPIAPVAAPSSIAPMAASVPPAASAGDLDRELAALAQSVRQKRRNRLVAGVSLIAAALMAGAVTVFAGKVREAEAGQAEAVAARIAEQDRIAQLNLQLEDRDRKIAALTAQLETARSDAEKAQKIVLAYKAAEAALAAAEEDEGGTAAGARSAKGSPKAAAARRGRAAAPGKAARGVRLAAAKKGAKCECKQGDPLCGCL